MGRILNAIGLALAFGGLVVLIGALMIGGMPPDFAMGARVGAVVSLGAGVGLAVLGARLQDKRFDRTRGAGVTVSLLITYLSQFKPETPVIMEARDAMGPSDEVVILAGLLELLAETRR